MDAAQRCGTCLRYPPPYERTYALFPYQAPIERMITRLKFQHQLSDARALGELLLQRIQTVWYSQQRLPDLILPIPLHPQRMRERGFNQAIEIARPVAKALAVPLDLQGMQRSKSTLAQSGLNAAERRQNMVGAFTATRDYSGLFVAVVDDVVTTGSTVAACCQVLRDHGAARIDLWCCARRG
jgi:ComF family protein